MTDMTREIANRANRRVDSIKQIIKFADIGVGIPAVDSATHGITLLQHQIHEINKVAGWWDNPREDGTTLMLMVSEISEAMEGNRKDLMDDKLPHRKMEEVELADALIRILDYAQWKGFDVAGAMIEKVAFNTQREDHKRENREKAGGKSY